ncbi:hypothetical protein BU23DRAFT_53400 [Bimuria novae-zelandiae CBS 107.79]|uniref:Uncharacterized protein n=1 Tax=Bimuria novae-zelandiae CBS 107.79 TaxID=1447943 RepID=A0A6A5ULL1_9PLEO|nr:hypothetical protein BU23DRAFT_53400 [Bimuria novae-zelandiae CBS 107.79]
MFPSHSHIRIVPREEPGSDYYEDSTPVYRSNSLQFSPFPLSDQESRRGSAVSETSTPNTTFAQMARRFNKPDMEGVEKLTSGPVPLSGYITLASRHRKNNKNWRALQPSDLGAGESPSDLQTDSSSPIDPLEPRHSNTFGLHPSDPVAQPSPHIGQLRNTPATLPRIQTNLVQREDAIPVTMANGQHSTSSDHGSDDISPTNTHPQIVDDYRRLFGQLPDIIRLHEQTGDFDGQVVFIGHPNRNVSAHQWMSISFQWVHIGTWCQTRKRIEGMAASIRMPNPGVPFNSIEYFKMAAEHQETMIKENGRPQTGPEPYEPRPRTMEKNADDVGQIPIPHFREPTPAARTVTKEKLEDPFVTGANHAQPAPMVAFNFRGIGDVGSMDFNYEFPSKSSATSKHHQQIYIQRERERLEALRKQSTPQREPHPDLPEVEFGEEAATGLTPPANLWDVGRYDSTLSTEGIHNRLQAGSRLADLGHTASRPSIPAEHRVAVPDFPINHANFRNSIPTGPTVANPYRGVSTLNAAAAPYRMPNKGEPSEASSSSDTVPNLPTSTVEPSLRYSDPDGMRKEQVHPIVNGFNKQAPTKQNWDGPFFADSIPTTTDPTASLSIQITNEQKLVDWYRDGQSISRQQDYAKRLVLEASVKDKAQSYGVIGEGSARKQNLKMYENTHLFARLYENLSEYAEESRAGGSNSYWTRAWKAPPLHLRDLGPDGNNSFYGGLSNASPLRARAASRPYQPYRGDSTPWGFSAQGSSPFPSHYGSSSTNGDALVGSMRRGF